MNAEGRAGRGGGGGGEFAHRQSTTFSSFSLAVKMIYTARAAMEPNTHPTITAVT